MWKNFVSDSKNTLVVGIILLKLKSICHSFVVEVIRLPVGLVSVSYTHLDVYKRQVCTPCLVIGVGI